MADENQPLEETTEEVVASSETTSEEVVETTEAQPEQEETVTPEEDTTPTVSPEEFLANFDWQNYEEGIEAVEGGFSKRIRSREGMLLVERFWAGHENRV